MTQGNYKQGKKAKCVCGGSIYKYERTDNLHLRFDLCFKCGRFTGKADSLEITNLFIDEPNLLLHLIKTGYLKPINLNTETHKYDT